MRSTADPRVRTPPVSDRKVGECGHRGWGGRSAAARWRKTLEQTRVTPVLQLRAASSTTSTLPISLARFPGSRTTPPHPDPALHAAGTGRWRDSYRPEEGVGLRPLLAQFSRAHQACHPSCATTTGVARTAHWGTGRRSAVFKTSVGRTTRADNPQSSDISAPGRCRRSGKSGRRSAAARWRGDRSVRWRRARCGWRLREGRRDRRDGARGKQSG
jgi:hypothetical protein